VIPLEVAVDQEPGWRVARLAGIVRPTPAARQLGRMPPDRVQRYGRALGMDLAGLGVTTDLAPVLDVTGASWNGVIGDRAFGADPATASRAAVAFMRGLADGGVANVGKHFPGHGATTVDSHRRLPVVHGSRAHLAAWELVPFRAAIRSGLDGVMVGHLLVTAVDARSPASLSPAVVGGLLRGRLGFDGLVVSDALEMGAITRSWPVPVAAERALAAGVDQLLLSDHTRVPTVLDRLQQAVVAGRLSRARQAEGAAADPGADGAPVEARTVPVTCSQAASRPHTSPVPRGPNSHLWQPATRKSQPRSGASAGSTPSAWTASAHTSTRSPGSRSRFSSPTAAVTSRSGSFTPVPEWTQVSASTRVRGPIPRRTAATSPSTVTPAGSS
jgi:beta-N-acetylhexosaminidase